MKRFLLYLLTVILLPQTISAAVLVGKTEGAFSVSPTGAATYTIPIKVQKGMSDFVPSISLSYSSQAGNGIAGMGFSISGLSTISIIPRSIYFDGQAEAIYTGEDNAFALDGMRLLLKDGTNGQTGSTYRTENEQYNIISITDSQNGTPATFQVKSTDGSTYRYGSTTGRYTLSNGEAYQWALDYAEDVLGNYIQYTYAQEGILYPTSITYGRNTHGTAGVDCTISFTYESRPDSVPVYLHGEQRFLKKRLKSIVCKYNGNAYRTYTLNYTTDIFSHLSSVTETGRSSSTVPRTTFEWEVPSACQLNCSSRSMESYASEDPEKENFFSGDLDGDGISEIISMETITTGNYPHVSFSVRKWNPDSQSFEFQYDIETQAGFEMGDMFSILKSCGLIIHASENKKNSIVYPFCRTFSDSKSIIFKFPKENVSLGIPMQGHENGKEYFPLYTFLDANKNGIDDIIIIEKEENNNHIYPAYLVSYNLSTGALSTTEINLNLQSKPDKILCSDFNSDGMPDLLVTTSDGYHIFWNRTGDFSYSDSYYDTQISKCDIIEAGDFNGDGLVDLIINDHNSTLWFMAENTGTEGNGYFLLHFIGYLHQVQATNCDENEGRLYCVVHDIDGDGKSDAIVSYPDRVVDDNPNTSGGCMCILHSNGETFSLYYRFAQSSHRDFPDKGHILQGNFDGQGGEIMYWGKHFLEGNVGWNQLKNPTLKPSSQKIVSITDGLGATDSIGYGLLTEEDVYSVTNHHAFPLVPMAGGIPVVRTRTESIPTDSRTTNYSYANGFVHLQGKGFLGFKDIKTESSTGIVTETHCWLDSTFHVLLPTYVKQSNANGVVIKQEDTGCQLESAGGHSYTTSATAHYTSISLDSFGESEYCLNYVNGLPQFRSYTDGLLSANDEITYWESPLNNVWLKGLPEEIETYRSAQFFGVEGDDVYEKTTYERVPSTGQILKETRRRNGQVVSTDGYSYNEYGQMILHYTVPFSSTDTLVTRYEYDSFGHLKKEYDPKGLYKTYTYSPSYGTLLSLRDFDGITTHYAYDAFLRETMRRTPIDSIRTTRAFSSYGGAVYSIMEKRTGETPVTTYYDAWERKVAESSLLASGTYMYTDHHYLPNGKVGFVSFPHQRTEAATGGTTYYYDDPAQRLTSTVDSNGKTSTWAYVPTQVVSCIDGVTTETNYYTPDKVHLVEDENGGVAEYFYNVDGTLSYIGTVHNASGSDYEGYEQYYEYDSFGRLIQTTDVNGVVKEYSYDVNGYPFRTTIGGSYVETNYDKFGILRSKTWSAPNEPSHTVTYTYDSKYRLIREQGEGYYYTYSYDQYGRLTSKSQTINEGLSHTLNVDIQYDANNHISRTASSLIDFYELMPEIREDYTYRNGYRLTDVLNDTLVWSLSMQDRWGNVTRKTDFQGYTTWTFDDYGNMLSMNRSGNYPLSESYTYNVHTGNMSSKNNVPLTYDNMNQLIGWGDQTYSYDCKGNITSQPSVGSFSYDGFRVEDMDADSSYIIDDSLRVSYYTAIERPKSIENEHYKADFYYDGNGDRYMMKVYTKTSGHYSCYFTRFYYGANVELTADYCGNEKCLYYAGGDAYTAPAVLFLDKEAGYKRTYQITRDNLGSVLQYVNANGEHYEYSYSPWGVRNYMVGNNTVFYQPGQYLNYCPFYRTYTGHEDLWMFGLLNANARLYSPYLGRFISPDPLLNSEGGALDYNPYIYARNNPYKYIDRNGEFAWLAFGIAALVTAGGVTNVVRNWSDIHSFWNGAGYFLIGAGATGAAMAGAAILGTAAAYAAPAIAGVLGVAAESAVALGTAYAAAGAVYYFYEGCLNSAMYGTPFEFSWNGMAKTMLTWGVPAGAEGYALARAKGLNGWTGLEKSNVMATRHRPVMTEPDAISVSEKSSSSSNIAAKDVPAQKPLQNHHYATDKNSQYTPKMKRIAEKYGLDLNEEWNIEKLPHQGRHPNELHDFVYKQMKQIDMIPNMNQTKFINHFEQRVKVPIRNNPDMLYKKYWLQKMR